MLGHEAKLGIVGREQCPADHAVGIGLLDDEIEQRVVLQGAWLENKSRDGAGTAGRRARYAKGAYRYPMPCKTARGGHGREPSGEEDSAWAIGIDFRDEAGAPRPGRGGSIRPAHDTMSGDRAEAPWLAESHVGA